MKLPQDLLSQVYTKPKFFLCETDKTKICQLETSNTQGSFKFNGLSELSFEVARVYNDLSTGEEKVNPYYDKIEALRLIFVEGFGYFELQGPELVGDGIKESKSCTAYSLEYTLSQKYLEDFYVNTGKTKSIEVINSDGKNIIPVTLYNPSNEKLSLLHLILEKVYGWTIGHVDVSLQTLSRQFEIDRESVYDFLMNEVCEKFNCYIVFNTINNTINVYAESLTAKFIGDGSTKKFIITPPFADINTVSVDGYKTTQWEYDITTGTLTLEKVPASGARIEVVDGALTAWETDVFVSFNNLAQEININYDADSIKTVLSVTYGDEGNIREVNLGLPYLTDLSYYYTVDWMGQDLYDAYTKYLQKSNQCQSEYADNSQKILELQNDISFAKNKMSLGYGVDSSVNEKTVGTYYVVSGGSYPNYTYDEVSLPADYNVNTVYYRINGVNVTEEKVHTLYSAVRKYFMAVHEQEAPEIKDIATKYGEWEELFDELTDSFTFVADDFQTLKSALTLETSVEDATSAVRTFLDLIWIEMGYTPLEKLYLEPYKEVQAANASAGYSVTTSEHYWFYYPVTIMIASLEQAIDNRKKEIAPLEEELSGYQGANKEITDSLLMTNNFTEGQLIRLNGFLREDELQLDDIIETSLDDINGIFKVMQDAMESGRIELQKLCQPQLQFSMSMANIYALPEFEPIIHQFQLGNVIKVALRPDYIKQSRLLQVDMNFDDFSDFSCEFGELTNLRTQSDIHADLLSKAISAGKSVATNSSYWTRGSDIATSTDLKIQQGLLDATTQIKAIDGTQGAFIDKYGIHLIKKDALTGEVDLHQIWMTNNMILFSDDGFKTSRSALGQVKLDINDDGEEEEYYGLIAEMVLSGYIEGSKIKGGTIEIGETTGANGEKAPMFAVDEGGNVTLNAATIKGYTTNDDVEHLIESSMEGFESVVRAKAAYFGTCDTAATDNVKIITLQGLEDGHTFSLHEGALISVRFSNDCSDGVSSNTVYLNVDGTDDKPIRINDDQLLKQDSDFCWSAKSVITFIYHINNSGSGAWYVTDTNIFKKYSSLKQTVDGFILDGVVTFKNLSENKSSENYTTINGANITSGTIKIGKYTDDDGNTKYHFEVDENGNVTMSAGGNTLDDVTALQDRIDSYVGGNITTWYGDVEPTTSRVPASQWQDDATKAAHLGDYYYYMKEGNYYYWNSLETNGVTNYFWTKVSSKNAIDYVRDTAQEAQNTADNKKRVFVSTPTPPYDVGDLWTAGSTGDLKKCNTAKATGESYSSSDWELATKYTDDTRANEVESEIRKTLDNITLSVTDGSTGNQAKISLGIDNNTREAYIDLTGAVTFSDLSTSGKTIINGANITTGTISADRLDVTNIFAEDITATGDIFFDNRYYCINNGVNSDGKSYLNIASTVPKSELWLSGLDGIDISGGVGFVSLEAGGAITAYTAGNQATINGKNIFVGETGTTSIQYGSVSYTVTVTFQHKFSVKPIVLIEQPFQNSNLGVALVTEKDTSGNITAYTGFKIKNQQSFDSSGTRSVCWAAFGTAQQEAT